MKVVITRSTDESSEFKKLLDKHSIGSFIFPAIAYAEPSDNYQELDDCIRRNHEFEWIVFLSKKAADIFFSRLLSLGGQLYHLSPQLKIACVGEKTADFVRNEVNFPVDFVPNIFNSDSLISEFHQKFFPNQTLPNISKQKILVPRQEGIEDDFKTKFENYGQAEIIYANAYQIINPEPSSELSEAFKKLLYSNEALIISFASSNTVVNFHQNIQGLELNAQKNLKFISIGPKTTETIKELFPSSIPLIESKEASFESMLESILEELSYHAKIRT